MGIHVSGKSLERVNIAVRLTEEKRRMVGKWIENIMEKMKFLQTAEQWREVEFKNGCRYIGEWKN